MKKILLSLFKSHQSADHIQFMKTRENNDTKGTVLARHFFLPGEVDPIKVNEIEWLYVKKEHPYARVFFE